MTSFRDHPCRQCLSHSPADLGSQSERLLVLSNTHEPAEELHVEGSVQVVPAERCFRQAAWQMLNRGSSSPPRYGLVSRIEHFLQIVPVVFNENSGWHGGSSGSVIFQVGEEGCDPASDYWTAALPVEFVE